MGITSTLYLSPNLDPTDDDLDQLWPLAVSLIRSIGQPVDVFHLDMLDNVFESMFAEMVPVCTMN